MTRSKRNGRSGKSPAFQWYPADALVDDEFGSMSYEERGVYITLLSLAWINNGLPGDVERVRRLLRMSEPEFERVWSVVGRCFTLDSAAGMFFNARLEREREVQQANRERMATLSKRAAAARDGDRTVHRTESKDGSPYGCLPSPQSPIPIPVERRAPPTEGPELPDSGSDSAPLERLPLLAQLAMHPSLDVPAVREALKRWEAHRSARGRQPWTAAAAASNLNAWERWGPAKLLAAVDHWIGRNSTTAFEPDPRDIDVHGSVESAPAEVAPSSGYLEMQAKAKAAKAAKKGGR